MLIRSLIPKSDLTIVHEFYAKAPDYWQLAEGQVPVLQKAKDFFTDTPPNCDPKVSLRLGLFLDDKAVRSSGDIFRVSNRRRCISRPYGAWTMGP